MINRDNYLDVMEYLYFQKTIKQCDERTINSLWSRLRHLLEWADNTRLTDAMKIKPTLPAYLGGLKNSDGEALIGPAHFTACCKTARAYFNWIKIEKARVYKSIDQNWVLSLRPPRSRSEQAVIKERELYQVEEVIKLTTCPVGSLMLRRMQAAAAFLFLSGMRIGAFVSLPVECVDTVNLRVYQLPDKGVNTKNHKAGITTLLNIPELLTVVREWDTFLRTNAFTGALWYAHFTQNGELSETNPSPERIKTRQYDFRDDLRQLCQLAGVRYRSPHKFRNGHAVYALKRAKNMEQLKAISQNLMHSTVGITDGVYGNLVNDDVHSVITSLAGMDFSDSNNLDIINQIKALISQA